LVAAGAFGAVVAAGAFGCGAVVVCARAGVARRVAATIIVVVFI
jgi:hypothetical protein